MTVPTIISAKVSPTHQGADSLARMVCSPVPHRSKRNDWARAIAVCEGQATRGGGGPDDRAKNDRRSREVRRPKFWRAQAGTGIDHPLPGGILHSLFWPGSAASRE